MKRTLLALVLGLTGGLFAHFLWFNTHRPATGADLDTQLAWMKQDLQLNDEQLARIKSLHEQVSPRLLALSSQLSKVQHEFAAFEKERQSVGQVDFLEFARYVELRRQLDRECADSTRRLVSDAAQVMTSEQRQQYLKLLDPALKKSGVGPL